MAHIPPTIVTNLLVVKTLLRDTFGILGGFLTFASLVPTPSAILRTDHVGVV